MEKNLKKTGSRSLLSPPLAISHNSAYRRARAPPPVAARAVLRPPPLAPPPSSAARSVLRRRRTRRPPPVATCAVLLPPPARPPAGRPPSAGPAVARGLLRPSPRAGSSARRRALLHPPPPRGVLRAAGARVVLCRGWCAHVCRPPSVPGAPDPCQPLPPRRLHAAGPHPRAATAPPPASQIHSGPATPLRPRRRRRHCSIPALQLPYVAQLLHPRRRLGSARSPLPPCHCTASTRPTLCSSPISTKHHTSTQRLLIVL
ncbi:hypothetical protein PVAP13_1KG364900 [Panicum virgatum]|uniref:Uncharacterized protein n=1 Tax=Panicum virgatum TaxID=38727 RepID=A0A8T0XDJ1_PANVG|nr:hypothetical protein PVAP13_1KG364900 [Panicum virgatum]